MFYTGHNRDGPGHCTEWTKPDPEGCRMWQGPTDVNTSRSRRCTCTDSTTEAIGGWGTGGGRMIVYGGQSFVGGDEEGRMAL